MPNGRSARRQRFRDGNVFRHIGILNDGNQGTGLPGDNSPKLPLLAFSGDAVSVSGYRLDIDDILIECRSLQGHLEITAHPQSERKIFLFCYTDSFVRLVPDGTDEAYSFVALPGEQPETLRIDDPCEYVSVSIPTALFQKRLSVLLDRPVERSLEFVSFPDGKLEILDILRDQLQVLPATPILRTKMLVASRNESLRNLLVDCFLQLFPNNYLGVLSDDLPTIAPRHVKRALSHIHGNPHRHIAPQVLADLSSVSKRTLQYAFQSVTGQTITDYQRLLRLSGAHEMVVSQVEIPLKAVAEIWGFGSYAAFGQSFKKAYGVSPAEARRGRELGVKGSHREPPASGGTQP
ncbi:helix-turn-helix domain-containing protein [Rhizobium sp. DKSPLA3]|uniref:Helix-turn-helix domain-containing protein n=1 Tax=Rhizobium quercicola TaxID=2901226 RepID=A0A9X1NN38_9HYPH|nr:helix-turn-helix domain-containing protein [Rhizobium quercicola]MCD7108047.1 helix-turn-helix domain-containing protein [Rhizobium quercicola]